MKCPKCNKTLTEKEERLLMTFNFKNCYPCRIKENVKRVNPKYREQYLKLHGLSFDEAKWRGTYDLRK